MTRDEMTAAIAKARLPDIIRDLLHLIVGSLTDAELETLAAVFQVNKA